MTDVDLEAIEKRLEWGKKANKDWAECCKYPPAIVSKRCLGDIEALLAEVERLKAVTAAKIEQVAVNETDILVVTVEGTIDPEQGPAIAKYIGCAIEEQAGCAGLKSMPIVAVMMNGMEIAAVPEPEMNKAGWYRKAND